MSQRGQHAAFRVAAPTLIIVMGSLCGPRHLIVPYLIHQEVQGALDRAGSVLGTTGLPGRSEGKRAGTESQTARK